MKRVLIIAVVLLAVAGGGIWYWARGANGAPAFRLAKVERGDLLVTVTATGTVQPVTQVQVGTQVSGTIQKLFVDFNSRVKAEQLVAQIDPAPFQARVDQDQANLLRAQADVERVKANLVQAEKELARSKELAKRELISAAELDAATAAYDSLVAQIKVAEATVAQSRSTLQISTVNLHYTEIKSPIDGLVISRNVDVGQTVAASLSAPTIFIIADSLKKIQVQASVAEADIGKIVSGQDVSFTVDAWREKPFLGKVSQIRLSPTTVQNVVTYTVLIDADNPEEKLLPGMTASVAFQVARHTAVLKIPNAALRFIPPADLLVDAAPVDKEKEKDRDRDKDKDKPRGPGGGGGRGRVWVQDPVAGLKAIPVLTVSGATDGSFTLLKSGEIQEGQEVVTGLVQSGPDAGMSNPFATQRPGGPRR
jgi:HlyD family secretion protein